METNGLQLFTISILLVFSFINGVFGSESPFNRNIFPKDFLFGASSSSYQYEGAAFQYGKGPSIWDTFTHTNPGKILDGSNGDDGVDFYHRYKDDVKLIKGMGLDAFRMSISWPRILPKGKLSGGVNKEGIAFYNNVFNELIANGVTPFVTLFHWDLPQSLEDEYLGFLSPQIIDDYKDFAQLCFKEFGDRVKHWMTFNEPYIFINGGYDGGLAGTLAPGRCSDRSKCAQGNSATEPYIVAHHLLLCHAEAVQLYREKFKLTQKGEIGIVLPVNWMIPFSNNRLDVGAAQRSLEFMYGWFAEPLTRGTYPKVMRSIVGNRLPTFTDEQKTKLIGSYDFFGLNYYSGQFVSNALFDNNINVTSFTDKMAHYSSTNSNGNFVGPVTGTPTFFDYPIGLYNLLSYTKRKYNNPTIYITENGYAFQENVKLKEGTDDQGRIHYYKGHIQAVRRALTDGVNVKGYFAWSFMDNFEWNSGFSVRYGLFHVDYRNGLRRVAKSSALWLKKFLTSLDLPQYQTNNPLLADH